MTANPMSGSTSFGHRDFDLFGSIRRRVLASVGAIVAWVSFTLLFLAFWTQGFTLLQDVVVVVVSLLALLGVLLGTWISFGLRFVSD
jgi:hypothetical protein